MQAKRISEWIGQAACLEWPAIYRSALGLGANFSYSVTMNPLALPLPVARPLVLGCFAFGLLAGTSSLVQAQIFSCKDAKGRTLTSDRPIAECAGAVRELREDGAMRREIAAPLTPEQQRLKDEEDARAQMLAHQKREQALRDKALLMAYPSVESLEQMRSPAMRSTP